MVRDKAQTFLGITVSPGACLYAIGSFRRLGSSLAAEAVPANTPLALGEPMVCVSSCMTQLRTDVLHAWAHLPPACDGTFVLVTC